MTNINKARIQRVVRFVLENLDDVNYATAYAEPGYHSETECILFGNWNAKQIRDPITGFYESPPNPDRDINVRVARVAEKLGIDIEWSDEWSTCDDCFRAIRTSPDSYSWVSSFKIGDSGITCKECLLEDTEEYINSWLLDNSDTADSFDIDLSEYGFRQVVEGESGFHPGQNDTPQEMVKSVPQDHDFVFQIDSTGQFDIGFSLWVRPYNWDSDKLYTLVDIKYLMQSEMITIPAGTEVVLADNLPADSRIKYWAESWSHMSDSEESWMRNYGFGLIESDLTGSK